MNDWSAALKKKGYVDNGKGVMVPVSTLTEKRKNIKKLQPGEMINKALGQAEPGNAVIGNKKVRNATKVEYNGIVFDSKLELTMYKLLQGAGISFEYQKTFELQAGFKYNNEAVRPIKKIVDFWLPEYNTIIDTKGYANDVSPLKHKMLKNALKYQYDIQPNILMPKNVKECEAVLYQLLTKNQTNN